MCPLISQTVGRYDMTSQETQTSLSFDQSGDNNYWQKYGL